MAPDLLLYCALQIFAALTDDVDHTNRGVRQLYTVIAIGDSQGKWHGLYHEYYPNSGDVFAFRTGTSTPDWSMNADCGGGGALAFSTRAFPVLVQ